MMSDEYWPWWSFEEMVEEHQKDYMRKYERDVPEELVTALQAAREEADRCLEKIDEHLKATGQMHLGSEY